MVEGLGFFASGESYYSQDLFLRLVFEDRCKTSWIATVAVRHLYNYIELDHVVLLVEGQVVDIAGRNFVFYQLCKLFPAKLIQTSFP